MKYIETLREGEKLSDIYLCKRKQSAMTKNGKAYENIILQDKTGILDGKIWDPNSQGISDFDALDYVEVVGDVISFQGAIQLNIKRVRKVQEGEYDPSDYLPVSTKNIEEMYREILSYVEKIENPYLQKLTHTFFIEDTQFIQDFKGHSAAKSIHHNFVGGLLEHTLGVVRLCDFFTKVYPILNKDLLLSAALFHDIGKMKELSTFPENDYTECGQLIGHIVIGMEWVGEVIRTIPDFPVQLAIELKHCILAHQGELEYGSPKKPALIEAMALYFADNTDAKIETLIELFRASGEKEEWMGYNRLFESNIRKTSMK